MKKTLIIILLAGVLPAQRAAAQDPVTAAIKEGIKKVIQAIDLQIQRIQTETIWLQNAQKAVENTMCKLKLAEIGDWVQRQKDLYGDYFAELWKVKNAITYYQRLRDIINSQLLLVSEYNRYYSLFKLDKHFTKSEIDYMQSVYAGIIDQSVKNLDQLLLVSSAFATQMSDAKRLEIINEAGRRIDGNYTDLRQFNTQNVRVSMHRAASEADLDNIKAMYNVY